MVINSSRRLTTLFLALFLELATLGIVPATATSPYTEQQRSPFLRETSVAQRQQRRRARLRFKVPNIRASRNLEGGAARGNCTEDGVKDIQMKALIPNTNIGLTAAGKPTFFFQISSTSVRDAKFLLLNAEGDTILYKKTFSLTKTGGIISFTLPADADALEMGREYSWEVSALCDPDDQRGNPRIQGSIQRIEPSQEVASDLAKASVRDRAALYAEQGFWYDTLKALGDLRFANPNDPTLVNDWKELLDSAGLSAIDQQPLLQCCTP